MLATGNKNSIDVPPNIVPETLRMILSGGTSCNHSELVHKENSVSLTEGNCAAIKTLARDRTQEITLTFETYESEIEFEVPATGIPINLYSAEYWEVSIRNANGEWERTTYGYFARIGFLQPI